jgi:hypothetical protein
MSSHQNGLATDAEGTQYLGQANLGYIGTNGRAGEEPPASDAALAASDSKQQLVRVKGDENSHNADELHEALMPGKKMAGDGGVAQSGVGGLTQPRLAGDAGGEALSADFAPLPAVDDLPTPAWKDAIASPAPPPKPTSPDDEIPLGAATTLPPPLLRPGSTLPPRAQCSVLV